MVMFIVLAVLGTVAGGIFFVFVFKLASKMVNGPSGKGFLDRPTNFIAERVFGPFESEESKENEMLKDALRGQEPVCPSCGAPNTRAELFCEYCGASLVKRSGEVDGLSVTVTETVGKNGEMVSRSIALGRSYYDEQR